MQTLYQIHQLQMLDEVKHISENLELADTCKPPTWPGNEARVTTYCCTRRQYKHADKHIVTAVLHLKCLSVGCLDFSCGASLCGWNIRVSTSLQVEVIKGELTGNLHRVDKINNS